MSRSAGPLTLTAMSTTHRAHSDGATIRTARLELRPWRIDDAEGALAIFGAESVTRWLSPAMSRVPSVEEMRVILGSWLAVPPPAPAGRWAVTSATDGRLLGAVAVLPLPPERSDLEVAWQLDPAVWG